ncbi:MAG: 1,4-dihydroxy-2-naphthoate polyprenyltransferase [uncultured Nocardioidaceae bacterium]|uniref:1,4-dihydroxy-2-naphthoate octaprenyltransferase n=1 Tax=uncultured Nocardioidaceae bacterium TaxID=253824 RepID=A0A6J4MS39_9ACTN|nr:MAG: 1,4-dihydroxy-2-naphthoate polyprenyltransferase [uncultured Nocardioidaceae bacterium]
MASAAQWVEGARPRTLPAAVSPVLAGSGVAVHSESFIWWKALLALVVALALQVGVNYANDYSDGVRGTDEGRVGPLRLVASGTASPPRVKAAAVAAFGVAAAAGAVLSLTTAWWLLLVGAAAIVAGWYYTGGRHPYGYRGFGEVGVFVFFGLVAVAGTAYVQVEALTSGVGWVACGVGVIAVAILVANNLRDIPTDEASGKRTLAVVIGDHSSRRLFTGLHAAGYVFAVAASVQVSAWLLLSMTALPLSLRAAGTVRQGATGTGLVAVLRDTGLTELVYATGLLAGYVVASAG